MRAGALKDLITIEKKVNGEDNFGEANDTFEKFKDAYSEVSHIGTSEKYFSGKYSDVDTKKFRIRYIPGVTTNMRILFDGSYFDIKEAVDPYMKKQELLIVGKEVS